MKKIFVLICFLLINISCDETVKENWELINKILKNPDSLSVILNDSNLTHPKFIKETKEKFYIERIRNHIIEHFQGEFEVLREREADIVRYINPPESTKIGHHHIVILSNIDNNEVLLFKFFLINNKWVLRRIDIDISTPLL